MTEKENWTLPAMFGVAVAILVVMLLMANVTPALSISISPTFNTLDANLTIAFTNSTTGLITGSATGYYLSVNGISSNEEGNNVTFYKPGNYTIQESVTNGGNYSISANSLVIVAEPLAVSIYPAHPNAVLGYMQSLRANLTGGTGPYKYQWYLGSNCSESIANATSQQYTTNALNQTQSYCVIASDVYNRQARANVTVMVSQNLYTSSGEYVGSFGTNGNYTFLAPSFVPFPQGIGVVNVTPYAVFNVSVCGSEYQAYETQLTPTFVNVSIANAVYSLTPNETKLFDVGTSCYVDLYGVQWDPIAITSDLAFFYQIPTASTTISTTSTSINTTTSTSISSTSSTSSIKPIGSSTTIPNKSGIDSNSQQKKKTAISDVWLLVIIAAICIIYVVYWLGKDRGWF